MKLDTSLCGNGERTLRDNWDTVFQTSFFEIKSHTILLGCPDEIIPISVSLIDNLLSADFSALSASTGYDSLWKR